jgi:F-type H+-transporting ATPase subunit b
VEINWFTFFAQIVNFFILVAVLQKFLYRPIIGAMDRREKTISDRLQAAEQQRQLAQEETEKYQQMQQELANQRSTMLAQVKAEVEQTQTELMQNVHTEVEQAQSRWQEIIQRQKDTFLRELRHHAAQQIQETIRVVLRDLAAVDLEQCIIQVFLEQIRNLNQQEKQVLCEAIAATPDAKEVIISSTFEISEALRGEIIQVIKEQFFADVNLKFKMTPDPICGVELKASGRKLAWSVENYLDNFTENLTTVFAEEAMNK